MNKGLGRLESIDARDLNFPMSAELTQLEPRLRFKYWNPNGISLDQGQTSSCVGHAWAHAIEDGPIMYKEPGAELDPFLIYNEARKLDEWEGELYHGTSVRGGAKAVQARGYISGYTWAFDLDTTIKALLTKSPVIAGTYWYRDMGYPNAEGVIKIGGSAVGGHAYKIDGVHLDRAMLRIKNSWGRDWGRNGFAYISFENFETLISRGGEICLPIEVKK